MIQRYFRTCLLIALLFLAQAGFSQIVINEIQTSNLSTIYDDYNQFDDWIEIYNAGSSSVNLQNYGLSDTISKVKFTFPDYTLAPGAYVIVFASDTNITTLSHWETAVSASDTWKYRANTTAYSGANWRDLAFNDASWTSGVGGIGFGDSDDGTTVATCVSIYMRKTFTVTDTSKISEAILNMDYDDGYVAYLNGVEVARRNVGIPGVVPAWNAIAPASYEALLYQNKYPDSVHFDVSSLRSLLQVGTNVLAIETHNESTTNADLTSRPFLSFKVQDGSSFYSATPSWFHKAATSYMHAKFKLSKMGESVILTDASGAMIDQKATGNIEGNNSLARIPDGSASWCLAATPTPAASNNSIACGLAYTTMPIFSLQSGFFTSTQSLNITTTYPGGVVRFTSDGSDVTESSMAVVGPITLTSTKVIRARVFAPNATASPQITHTYIINLNCHLPVFSITTDPKNLNDNLTGIFANGPGYTAAMPHFGANYWLDMEKPISLEFFERDKSMAFQFNAGISVTGGWSRTAPQKSLEINMGDKYGQADLNYSLEPDKPWNDKWNDFILHDAGNDRDLCKMRDALMCRLLRTTHNDYVAYEPCLVLLNGQNWGVYYTRENDDHHWVETNYGYKSSQIDFLKESYFFPGMEVKKGSDSAFYAMYNYAVNTSPTDTGYYRTISSMMDLENMADYFIAETYYPNDDWMGGGNNNLKLWRPKKDGGKFRYIIYDLEFGLGYSGSTSLNMLATARNPSPHNYNSDLFDAFTQNPTYKRYFINRYADLINTVFLPSNIQSMAYMFRDSLKYDMHLQFEKWAASDSTSWINNIASMLTFANGRPANARNIVQSEFGMAGQVTLTLQVSPAGAGTIQISTINPATYPWSGVYFNGNPVTITAIPNPGYSFDHWRSNTVISSNDLNKSTTYNFTSSDVITCYFTGSAATPDIAISEINFHSDSIHDAGDWVELHNRSSFSVDISNWKFRDEADNHTYSIPVNTVMAPNSYLVMASDMTKFRAINPSVANAIGDYGFDFSNNGEQLRLFDKQNNLFTSVTYADYSPWPLQADGLGYTLERLDETLTGDDGSNWFAGCIGGSPGRTYSAPAISISGAAAQTICTGSSITLTANGGVNYSYQWQKDHTNIAGATSSTLNATEAGTYTVFVTANGCSNTSDSVVATVRAMEQVTSVSPASRCGSGTLTLSAAGTSALNWFTDSTTTSVLVSGNSFTTPVLNSTTSYFVQASGNCPSNRQRVTAQINAVAAAPDVQSAERCGSGTVTLSANDTALIKWFDAQVGGNLLASSDVFTTPVLTQSTIYYVEAGIVCPSARVSATATINSITSDPVASGAARCGAGSVTLTATDTASIRWYDAAVGGNLLTTGTSYITPVLSTTTTYYLEAGLLCLSNRVPIVATIENVGVLPVVTDGSNCGSGSIVLHASSSSALNWFDAATGGTPIGSGTTFTTPVLSASTDYYVESGVVCPSPRVAVHANILAITADPIVTGADRCGAGSLTLSATDTAIVKWYSAASGGLVLATAYSYTTPSITQTTTYYAQAGTTCPSSRVPVLATINAISPNPTTNGGMNCGTGSVALSASSSGIISWYDAPNGNLLFTGNNFTTPIISQTTSYYAQTGGICPSSFVPAQATIQSVSANPV